MSFYNSLKGIFGGNSPVGGRLTQEEANKQFGRQAKMKAQNPKLSNAQVQGRTAEQQFADSGRMEQKTMNEGSLLDNMWSQAKNYGQETGGALGGAAMGMGSKMLNAPKDILGSMNDVMSGKDEDKTAMIEAMAQGGVSNLTDAMGVFAGEAPDKRGFASPTMLEDSKKFADIIGRNREVGTDMAKKRAVAAAEKVAKARGK